MTPLDPATRARLRESCIEVVTRGMGRVDPVAVIDVLDALDDREAKLAKAEQERDAAKAAGTCARMALAVVEAARTASLSDSDEAHRALCVALSDYDSTKGCSDG